MITKIAELSDVGEARRRATDFARKAGGDDTQSGRIALVATEMATNLVKHAGANGSGMMVIDRFDDATGVGVELLAIDSGPGMADIKKCQEDGFSTSGSAGTGLGAISRQADVFSAYSRPGLGAVISARFAFAPPAENTRRIDICVVSAAYPGETVSGDGWAFASGKPGQTLLVVDGSGHGPQAARAAEAALEIFADRSDDDCVSLVDRMHRGLMPTRGAALAVARVDAAERVIRFVGVGNIAGLVLTGPEARQMASNNGTVGHIAPRIREFAYPFTGTPCVIMHSDGLSNRWRLTDYPGLAACHPSLIAAVLFRDFRRERDDATIAVMRPR